MTCFGDKTQSRTRNADTDRPSHHTRARLLYTQSHASSCCVYPPRLSLQYATLTQPCYTHAHINPALVRPSHPPSAVNMAATTELHPEDISLPPSPPLKPQLQDPTLFEENKRVHAESLPRPLSPLGSLSTTYLSVQKPSQPRTQSPSSRGHTRSRSSTASIYAPPMQRAHSSPGVDAAGRFVLPLAPRRPSSPSAYTGRRRSPLRATIDEPYPGMPTWSSLNIEPNIPEHAELDISTPTLPPLSSPAEADLYSSSPSISMHNTFPRSRRKPVSRLHQSASAPSLHTQLFASTSSSPILAAQRYTNEPYPHYSFSSASSMPSTPTSFRSRSPSISSLETIPDTPDAEEAARIEAEELARLRTAAGLDDMESKRRSSGGFGTKKERKRWSVCGAERRADFSLEPIEE